jgi:DNA invertase Pin-like site-specific DNA recombinase
MKVIGYGRVSTEYQIAGLSLDWQESVIRRECAARGWELFSFESEHASGKNIRNRKALQRALRLVGPGDVLMIAKLDRLSRSAHDFYALMSRAKDEGWSVLCLDPLVDMTTPFGKALAGMSAIFAELERDLISQRQKESVAARKAAGTYKKPQKRITEEAEDRITHLRSEGMSLRGIARQLELEGFPAPGGGRTWHPKSVARFSARLNA